MPKRAYLFGIGSPKWQESTGHTVNKRGVPIPTRKKATYSVVHDGRTVSGGLSKTNAIADLRARRERWRRSYPDQPGKWAIRKD